MILTGVKREEYKEIKPYWTKRMEYFVFHIERIIWSAARELI